MVEKIHGFAVFNDKYLRLYGCNHTDFKATEDNCPNLKTEILSEIIEIQIIGMQINFLFHC